MTQRLAPRSTRPLARLTAALLCAGAAWSAQANCGSAGGAAEAAVLKQRVYAVDSEGALLRFNACQPGSVQRIGAITGLQPADARVVGIDFRVQDGLLYAVGNGGGIYTVDLATAAATKASQLSTALDGTQFGVDFNPAANALRIVSNTGQNLRHPFANPEPRITLVDLALNYTAGTTATGIVSAAYTNNDLDASTATTLFDLDSTLGQVALQVPPNNGSLAATGKLGVVPTGPVGFDILAQGGNTVTRNNLALASMTVDGQSGLYRVNLLTGKASLIGSLGQPVADIAITLD